MPDRLLRRAAVAAAVLATVTLAARLALADVPVPTLEGPLSPGGAFLQATSFDLADVGYVQEEFFIAGTATAYSNAGAFGIDGRWDVTPASTTAYKTRIMVHRPVSKKKFNGTVVVEWLNVSGGVDAAPDWLLAHTALIREGFAWVGVSAQKVGVEGGPAVVGIVSLPLKQVNPARYGSLNHPGDSFSYDIFSQAAQAARAPQGPLAGYKIKRMIAAGESQSAFRMVTYANAIHPVTGLFDGYFIHSRGSFGAALSEAPQKTIPTPGNALSRTDLDVPVLVLETETDLTFLGYANSRQDDSAKFRLWEVAGTAHADTYVTVNGGTDLGTDPAIVQPIIVASPIPGVIDCNQPINAGPHHFLVNAAFSALNRWVKTGKAPKSQPRLELTGPPTAIATDSHGNALGGIRTPAVDAPIASYTGTQTGALICILFGTTTPFDAPKLASLYPTHKAFTQAVNKSARKAVRAKVLLRPDARLIQQWAKGAAIGG